MRCHPRGTTSTHARTTTGAPASSAAPPAWAMHTWCDPAKRRDGTCEDEALLVVTGRPKLPQLDLADAAFARVAAVGDIHATPGRHGR